MKKEKDKKMKQTRKNNKIKVKPNQIRKAIKQIDSFMGMYSHGQGSPKWKAVKHALQWMLGEKRKFLLLGDEHFDKV